MTNYLSSRRSKVKKQLETFSDVKFAEKKDNRYAREIISKLRKSGRYFIPVGDYQYKLYEICTQEEIELFLRIQVAQMNSQYFDTVKPLMDLIGKERTNELYRGGFFNEEQ